MGRFRRVIKNVSLLFLIVSVDATHTPIPFDDDEYFVTMDGKRFGFSKVPGYSAVSQSRFEEVKLVIKTDPPFEGEPTLRECLFPCCLDYPTYRRPWYSYLCCGCYDEDEYEEIR